MYGVHIPNNLCGKKVIFLFGRKHPVQYTGSDIVSIPDYYRYIIPYKFPYISHERLHHFPLLQHTPIDSQYLHLGFHPHTIDFVRPYHLFSTASVFS